MASASEKFSSGGQKDSDEWRICRDRVMLYVRGLDLPPGKALGLAAESIEASSTPSPADVMDILEQLLEQHGLTPDLLDGKGRRISSFPPLNRSVMVAEEMDRVPWKKAFVRFLRRWRRELIGQER